MLKREHRLPASIRLSSAKIARFPTHTVKYQPSDSVFFRAGVVISKRVSSKATDRNRLKRIVTTCLVAFLPSYSPPLDVLIILHPTIGNLNNKEVAAQISASLQKLSV
jgi:ribonuclease P protein component